MSALTIGAAAGGVAWKLGRDFQADGSNLGSARFFTGMMWVAAGTATALLVTSLVLKLSDDNSASGAGLSATPVGGAGAFGLFVSVRWW